MALSITATCQGMCSVSERNSTVFQPLGDKNVVASPSRVSSHLNNVGNVFCTMGVKWYITPAVDPFTLAGDLAM